LAQVFCFLFAFAQFLAMKVVFASLIASVSAGDWSAYKQTYGRTYNGLDAEDAAQAAYETNCAIIEQQNALNDGLTFGENQFTDMTPAQFAASAGLGYKGKSSSKKTLSVLSWQGETLATAVDWTDKGAVNAVKNQGQCGSCWAFSTAASTEGVYFVSSGSLVSVSEQMLVDCSTENSGCNGGLMDLGFEFFENSGPVTEASYGYTGTDDNCKSSGTAAFTGGYQVTGFTDVTPNSVSSMALAVNGNPVSVAIQANQMSFQGYSGGVLKQGGSFFTKCGQRLDHGVAVVGYGTDGGTDYWKVRNSWGASWGEGGYIRIEKSSANTCGVISEPSYPVVTSSVAV